MRGNTFRRAAPPNSVRVIRSIEDSDQDYFITYEEANRLIARQLLRAVNLGTDYPHSFMESQRARTNQRVTEHPSQSAS